MRKSSSLLSLVSSSTTTSLLNIFSGGFNFGFLGYVRVFKSIQAVAIQPHPGHALLVETEPVCLYRSALYRFKDPYYVTYLLALHIFLVTAGLSTWEVRSFETISYLGAGGRLHLLSRADFSPKNSDDSQEH